MTAPVSSGLVRSLAAATVAITLGLIVARSGDGLPMHLRNADASVIGHQPPALLGVEHRAAPQSQHDRLQRAAVSYRSVNAKALNPGVTNEGSIGGLSVSAKVFTSAGWVPPGETYPLVVTYTAGDAAFTGGTVDLRLNPAAVFVRATPAAEGGSGTEAAPLRFRLPALTAGESGKLVIEIRAKTLQEDAEVMWKNLSSRLSVQPTGSAETLALLTHGPKVTTLRSARFGDRPFPVVMVEYQDVKHCTGASMPFPECGSNHTAERLDAAVNSKTSGTSLWQLYQDMSFGQIHPIGRVSPAPGSTSVAYDASYPHKFSEPAPGGVCTGTTLGPLWAQSPAAAAGLLRNRIANGWYVLPGTQAYYGSDAGGQAALVPIPVPIPGIDVAGIDNGCGPTGKIVYDAASLADPDIDYNDYDTDKDGVVDFFNLMFAGDGGNGSLSATGLNNIWPHKSDLRFYFTDAEGRPGYVSNDQLKNHYGEPMYYTNRSRSVMTTTVTEFPVMVMVGPYNVNPETAVDTVSVVAHEYGHSLGLPDFYSTGDRDTFGTWELMASDYFQYMTAFARQRLGWIVPKPMQSGEVTLRESKYDTGSIDWKRPDGTPYTLTGEGIHNADAYRVGLPTGTLIDEVPSGSRAWHSGAGNDFGCPPAGGHNLDVFLPDLAQTASASAITLEFQSLYEIEWDFDYGFVMVSDDEGETWTALRSLNGTTISGHNPNTNACYTTYGNAITGVSGTGANTTTNPSRQDDAYPAATFVADKFDLSAYKGKSIVLRFAYSTDSGLSKRGWFIDDIKITAGDRVVYASDFETDQEPNRLFPRNWSRVSTTDPVDVDHAYYVELRDRIGNDWDGKLQSERGTPAWQPGVSMIYSDEQHGFGNTGVDDPPAQSPVDAVPEPGNATPNLNDAAFTTARAVFDGCRHIDNYANPAGPDGMWKLPEGLKFTVTAITGLSTGAGARPEQPPTATLTAELYPNCLLNLLPPVLAIAEGYENPDTDGAYLLSWERPADAVGPDVLQEASSCEPSFTDDASDPLLLGENGLWSGSPQWLSLPDPDTGDSAYYIPSLIAQDESLTLIEPIRIPAGHSATLSYHTRYGMEAGYDFGHVEVSTDGGSSFRTVESLSGPDAPLPVSVNSGERSVELGEFAGNDILIRFRMETDGYTLGVPAGWWINNIRVTVADWANVATVSEPRFQVRGHAVGSFCYRAQTKYAAGSALLDSPYSNIVKLTVASTVPVVNRNPVAVLTALPLSGRAPLDVTLNGGDSNDADGQALRYRFDFGDGSAVETNDTARRVHTYRTAGSYVAKLVVIDSEGAESTAATQTITVTAPPVNPPGPGPVTPVAPGSDGGRFGGAAGGMLLAGLALAAALRRRRTPMH